MPPFKPPVRKPNVAPPTTITPKRRVTGAVPAADKDDTLLSPRKVSPEWCANSFSVWMETTKSLKPISGEVFKGVVAVHLSLDNDGKWTVSLIASGIAAVHCLNSALEAKLCGELLYAKCRLAVTLPTKQKILQAIAPWVKPWALACKREGRCVPATAYQLAAAQAARQT